MSDLRAHGRAILDAALAAVDPRRAVAAALDRQGDRLLVGGETLDLGDYARVVVVGAGKAGASMAAGAEDILGDRISEGLVVVKDGHGGPTRKMRIVEASHPVPDQRGVDAGREIAELVKANAAPDTLFLVLISGGGSALLVSPAEGLDLADKQATTKALLASGADIAEINALRKHLSAIKGGNLARLAFPGKVVSLLISDVVGDRLDVIASGPTVGDTSTWADCAESLRRRGLWGKVPEAVRRRIEAGLAGEIPDTPHPNDDSLSGVIVTVVSSNWQALTVARDKARELGYEPMILSSSIEGETAEIARMHCAIARETRETGNPLAPPCCLISGGETTVTLGEDPGQGGRNQEFALAACLDLEGMEGVLALSAGTDGTDGPTDAAGAMADGLTAIQARDQGMNPRDYLARHDAYPFFAALDDLLITGPTKTNVMDIRLMLVD